MLVNDIKDVVVSIGEKWREYGSVQLNDGQTAHRDAGGDEHEPANRSIDELQSEVTNPLWERLGSIHLSHKIAKTQANESNPDRDQREPALQMHPGIQEFQIGTHRNLSPLTQSSSTDRTTTGRSTGPTHNRLVTAHDIR